MSGILDELAVAFVMRCDEASLTYEEGVDAAQNLCDDLIFAAEERKSYATTTEGRA